MTDNLPATIDNLSYEDYASMTGMPAEFKQFLPTLRVNRDPTDDDEHQLPMGHYCLDTTDGRVFGKPVKFRAFINAYQILRFCPIEKKYVNRTIIFNNWKEEKLDALGGLNCGKVFGKAKEQLTADEAAKQKDIKTHRLLYGIVSFEGVTATKKPVNIENVPVVWRTSGTNFIPVGDALGLFTKKKLMAMKFNLILDTKREKAGATIYYPAVITPDFSSPLPVGKTEMETLKVFQEIISVENQSVLREHAEARKTHKDIDLDPSDVQELANDLNDDVSDLGKK